MHPEPNLEQQMVPRARKPRAPKKPPPKPKHKAMITAVSALIIAVVDLFLSVRFGFKLF